MSTVQQESPTTTLKKKRRKKLKSKLKNRITYVGTLKTITEELTPEIFYKHPLNKEKKTGKYTLQWETQVVDFIDHYNTENTIKI